MDRFHKRVKRTFDVVVALVALPLSVPFQLVAIVIVQRYYPGRPYFISQSRVGRHEQNFEMLKLRTLRQDYDPVLHQHDPLPPAVVLIRRWSFDELIQFWHVLTGVMSVVGNRPLVPMEHYIRYAGASQRIMVMAPGMVSQHSVKTHRESITDLPVSPGEYVFDPTAVELTLGYVEDWSIQKDWCAIQAYLVLLRGYLPEMRRALKNLRTS